MMAARPPPAPVDVTTSAHSGASGSPTDDRPMYTVPSGPIDGDDARAVLVVPTVPQTGTPSNPSAPRQSGVGGPAAPLSMRAIMRLRIRFTRSSKKSRAKTTTSFMPPVATAGDDVMLRPGGGGVSG